MTATAEEAEVAGTRGATWRPLRHRSFRLLWLGQLTSQVGDWVAFVALTGLVWDLTGAGRWVAALRATHAAPIPLLGPLAGVGAFAPALLGYACAGCGQMVISMVGLTLFQRAVADEVRGRAFSIYNTVSHGVLLLVMTGAAALADLVALGPTLALAGLSQLLGVAGALRWLPRRGDPDRRTADGGTGRARVP